MRCLKDESVSKKKPSTVVSKIAVSRVILEEDPRSAENDELCYLLVGGIEVKVAV